MSKVNLVRPRRLQRSGSKQRRERKSALLTYPSNLTPGGTIEIQDIMLPILSDDNTFPDGCALSRWSTLLRDAFAGTGRHVDSALSYPQQLSEAGFVEINIVQEKWPTNRWPRDKKYKQLGKPARLLDIVYITPAN
ncbi:hypothetical protein IMZ48_14090 [Candidatus Bathyarchaeota archaeon]|nr:hypothetical protein [Candidatus Bathyarchaeota archaeon]